MAGKAQLLVRTVRGKMIARKARLSALLSYMERTEERGDAMPLRIVRFIVRRLHVKTQSAISCVLRAPGAGRLIFGGDAAGRLEAYRRERLVQVSGASKKDYLLSFPSSGNHWTRFILEFFSGMPTQGYGGQDVPLHRNLFGAVVSPLWHVRHGGCFFVQKSHSSPRGEGRWTTNCNSVLLLIRHYYETGDFRLHTPNVNTREEHIRWYLHILLEYERLNARKMHVYYEDLIRVPRETITSILVFYGIDNPALFEYFMRDYRKMQHLSRNATGRDWRGFNSGDDLFHHRKRHPENSPEIDELFQRIYSESRYDEIRHLVDRYYTRPD